MVKEILPNKLIISFNSDGSFRDGILQYKLKIDGAIDERKFYTIAITKGIDLKEINSILEDSKLHAEKGEKIK